MLISRISGCKGSTNRTKYQIFLRISEVQPNFKLRSRLKVVQGERKTKTSFEYLPFPYGRRPKGSEVQPNFKLRSRLKIVQTDTQMIFNFPRIITDSHR